MIQETTKRKLTAILSADVKEYSRLMSQDERGTIRTLTAYREAMSNLIQDYKGRVVDSPGDNLLAEFGSVVDAVNCAVEIQRDLAERNAELSPARQMEFRIGINLGDVVEEEGRLYGDGVNIAARLESLAEPGGVAISGTAYDQVVNKLGLEYEFLGEQTVKNIERPIRVYRVLSYPGAAAHRVIKAKSLTGRKWLKGAIAATTILVVAVMIGAIWNFYFRPPPIEPASEEKMAFPLPEKPSIAVLPFTNISEDPKQDYFSDGLTEEIITALSKVPKLFVIAWNSTFTYKGKPVKVQQIAEELGVRYVLEGSVRKANERVRITAQLIDATTGKHLWAEKYDRDLRDIFALQDEIMMKVIASLQVKLTEGEQALIVAGGTNSFKAYTKFLQGLEYAKRFNKEGNLLARKITQEAIGLDPNYPRGYRLLATTHWLDVMLGISPSPKQSLAKAAELYQKVIAMDPSDAVAHGFLGMVYTLMRKHEKGIAEAEKAVAINPNAADAQCFFGYILHFHGRHREAIEQITKAIRLNPYPPNWYFMQLGFAYCHAGEYEKAIEALKKALRVSPDNLLAHIRLAETYSLSGHEQEARAEVAEVLRINPKFSLTRFAKTLPYKNNSDRDLLINALRKAGLPNKPPLRLPDKPSIAVLPFTNMSGDPEQEYFSDGITEEIITALSKVPSLFVIARNSTFTYKGKPVKVQQVGRGLGVRYVLEGSVRKQADRVRITAQLVDAKTGHHLWAERYDRELKDIFAIQDEITMKIITELQVKLTEAEEARLLAKGTGNLETYLKFLQGREHFHRFNKENNALARDMFQEAIALDPVYPKPYAFLGTTHLMDMWLGSSKSPRESLAKAIELAQRAIALDDSYASAHGLLGHLYLYTRQYDKATAEWERGVALNPNSASALAWLGTNIYYLDRPDQAIPVLKKAIRLNPFPPSWYLNHLAMAYRDTGRYEEAISVCKKVLHREPKNVITRILLAATYSLSGREEEARAEAAEVLRIDPKYSLERLAKTRPHKNQANTESFIDSLRKAGLK
jgi:adenylate cyclase